MVSSRATLVCLVALTTAMAIATSPTLVNAATCASSPAVPTGCRNADSCVDTTGDVCNVCAGGSYLSNPSTGECSTCRNEAAAANARWTGATTCSSNGAFFFQACMPWGAGADAHCAPCSVACANCTAASNDKMAGCTICANGFYDSNSLQLPGGICQPILTQPQASLLGAAESFAVLGASTVTNTGGSIITGDIGVSPGTAITGIPPGIIVGVVHATDTTATAAHSDATIAYAALAGRAAEVTMSGVDLAGKTLYPGVYKYSSSAMFTGSLGALFLDGNGDKNSEFIFQIGSSLTTGPNSQVILMNGARACNVYWQVGSSATFNVNTQFTGTIITYASITLTTGVSLNGRALALNGAVALDSNAITMFTCATPECAGPAFLVPASPSSTASCTLCDVSCATCTTVTANLTGTGMGGCSQCEFGYYDSNTTAKTGGVCTECRTQAAAAAARVAGTTMCNENGASFYFKNCVRGEANVASDAACVGTTAESALPQVVAAGSLVNTCAGAGAFFFEAATDDADSACIPCDDACATCTGRGNSKQSGCTTCATGYYDSNGLTVAGGSCIIIPPTISGQEIPPTNAAPAAQVLSASIIAVAAVAVLAAVRVL